MIFINNNIKKEKKIKFIKIKNIIPNKVQQRTTLNQDSIRELAQSIKENGLIHPIIVRKLSVNKYELISGERRLRAIKFLKKIKILCMVIECDNNKSSMFALTTNLQRKNLNFFEEAEAIWNLMGYLNITVEEIAIQLGKKESIIKDKLKILMLSINERESIIKTKLTEKHVMALLKLKIKDERIQTLNYIINNKLDAQQSEIYIDDIIRIKEKKRH